ncbi:hypothetical protein GCM10007359_21690 [Rothia aerolata]|uniref:Uncharacterized protein n=1 Tax=Rothia aerolata TaxID=1812262 RepID=A0A917IWV2_9MICC|nr:hypothetical protein GCM10007359_21690 [Rothia aerolata]
MIKHGGPGQPVNVSLLVESTLFRITCQNAVGETPHRKEYLSMGYGLAGLRERCELLGGTFSSGRVEDKWQVDITLPIGA